MLYGVERANLHYITILTWIDWSLYGPFRIEIIQNSSPIWVGFHPDVSRLGAHILRE